MNYFNDEIELRGELRVVLSAAALDEGELEAAVDELVARFASPTVDDLSRLEGFSSKLGLVIQDDQMLFLESLATGFGIGAGIATTTTAKAGSIGGLLVAGFDFLNRIRKKVARLDNRQCQLIAVLRRFSAGLQADELTRALRRRWDYWNGPRVEETLRSLQTLRCRDGTALSVVEVTPAGRWSCAGI